MKTIYNFLKNNQQVYIRFSSRNGVFTFSDSKEKKSDTPIRGKSEFLAFYKNALEKYVAKVGTDVYSVVYFGTKDGEATKKADTIRLYTDWDSCQKDTAGEPHILRKCKQDDIPSYISEFMTKDFSAIKIERSWFFANREKKAKELQQNDISDEIPVKEPVCDNNTKYIVIHTGIRENLTLADFIGAKTEKQEDEQLTLDAFMAHEVPEGSSRGKKLVVNLNLPPEPEKAPERHLTQKQKAEKGFCEAHGIDYDDVPPWADVEEYVSSKKAEKTVIEPREKITVQLSLTPETLKRILAEYDVELLSGNPVQEAESFFDQF